MVKIKSNKVRKLKEEIKKTKSKNCQYSATNVILTRSKTNLIISEQKKNEKIVPTTIENKNKNKVKIGAVISTRSKITKQVIHCEQNTKIEIEKKISNQCVFNATRSKSTVIAQSTQNNKNLISNQMKNRNETCISTVSAATQSMCGKKEKTKNRVLDVTKLVDFKNGEIVLGRMKGYCFWPAKVRNNHYLL